MRRAGAPSGGTPAGGWRAEVVAPHGLVDTQASGRTHRCAPTDGCRNCPDISAAWHRRRPGGPGRYSVAMIRACGVIDACRPGRDSACHETKKEPGVDARPVLAFSVQPAAAMSPRTGGPRAGEAPRPFFLPISSGRNGGPGRAGPSREGHPGVRTWSPSSAAAWPRHLPPVGGRLRADDIRPYGHGS